MHLSVIIPTLSRQPTALLLAARLKDIFAAIQIEVIVVLPKGQLKPADTEGVHFVSDPARGVYLAYRAGLALATGTYCWFMGDDDCPLESAAVLVSALIAGQDDLLVAPVIFSSGRIYRPTRSTLILHFLNWCQQGVIYRRSLLARHRFFRRLTVQADQYVNILLRSDPAVRIAFYPLPICVFGVNGVSGRLRDVGYAHLRRPLARRTLSPGSYVMFRVLLLVEPIVKRLVRLR
jgi:hypothetical protein